MELEKLREYKEGGVKELWEGQVSPEVREAWEKARVVLGEGKEECLKVLTAA